MVKRVLPQQAKQRMEAGGCVVLDVRGPEEFAAGHLPGAVCIPGGQLADRAAAELPCKSQPILVYCRSGRRSAAAAAELDALGYAEVWDLGGILRWPYAVVTQ